MESFLRESKVYLLIGGAAQAAGALVLGLVLLPIAHGLTHASFQELLLTYLLFNVFLLFWGCLGQYLFLTLSYGKLYVSMDRTVDWLPFIPFGQWVLDQTLYGPRGYLLNGATLWQLGLLWAAVAIPVWLLSIVSTVVVRC